MTLGRVSSLGVTTVHQAHQSRLLKALLVRTVNDVNLTKTDK